ncbi:MAG TPA: FkbM family methyltransferase [Vicinamibacterales bacterium]|jgi:FkbM family methyltransferase
MIKRAMSAAYGQALRALYSRGGVPWDVHDETVRIDPGVRHLVPHESEPALYRFLRGAIRPGDVVLDVGAFLGIYAVLAARWVGAGGRVVAFEPTPSSARLAQRHFSWNQPEGGRIDLIEAAVSDRRTRAAFHQYDAHAMPYVNSLAAAADTTAAPALQDVSVVTIDEVCRELKIVPTIVRMDVQGAEIHALRGARDTIRAAGRLTMAVEMHPQCWRSFGVGEEDARQTIHELGLTARPLVASEPLFGRDTHVVLTRGEA